MTCPHCCCITLSTLFTGLYIYIHTYRCNLLFRFTLQRSKTRLRLLTWPLTMGGTSTRTLSLPYKPKHACMWDYIKGTHIILSVHAFVTHTHTDAHANTHILSRMRLGNTTLSSDNCQKKALQVVHSDVCALPVCILLYVIIRCWSTIKQTGVEGLALLSSGEDARQRPQPHLFFLLLTLRLLQIF